MKQRMLCLVFGVLTLTVASVASARVDVSIGVNPFYGAYGPPVVYEPAPYYAAPPAVYIGGGYWGDDDRGHWRGHHRGRHR